MLIENWNTQQGQKADRQRTPAEVYKASLIKGAQKSTHRLTPKGVSTLEAEIRKHLPNPASAVFSGWDVKVNSIPNDQKAASGGHVMVEIPGTPGWQLWLFTLYKDGTLIMQSHIVDQSGKLIAHGAKLSALYNAHW
jgi:hypothetical protein